MKRKSILVFWITFLALGVAACSTAALPPSSPTASAPVLSTPTTSSNATTVVGDTIPTATNSVGASSTAISMDTILACAGGKISTNPTVELTEGPYYTSGSPEQANLYQDGMAGTKLVVSGYVYDTSCQPVANAWLDFWQADANGVYDNNGYTLRGHQFTDANGHFELTTVVPGIYPGRTEHIHVKIQAPNGKVITSQLFFPGVSQNDSDGIYDSSLLLALQETGDGLQGQFNFVVPAHYTVIHVVARSARQRRSNRLANLGLFHPTLVQHKVSQRDRSNELHRCVPRCNFVFVVKAQHPLYQDLDHRHVRCGSRDSSVMR